jgi:hypothetical protein
VIGILIAVVVLVGVIACADLLISFALIRRVAALQSRGGTEASGPAVGREVGQFRVPLLGGGEFSRPSLDAQRTLVVFLTTSCEPCRRAIAELSTMAGPLPWPLYVIIIETDSAAAVDAVDALEVAGQMPTGSRVGVITASEAPLEAFGIDGYPTVLTVEDGIIRASGFRVAALAAA